VIDSRNSWTEFTGFKSMRTLLENLSITAYHGCLLQTIWNS